VKALLNEPLFDKYLSLLIEANRRLNLTAVTEPGEIRLKHFEDSVSIAGYIPRGAAVIDVGSGAGFPGIPLKISRPDLCVTLLEAAGKRAGFLKAVIGELELSGISVITARAEELAKAAGHRERYDAAAARAVAALPVLAEMCLPFVRPGGVFIAMKGQNPESEAASAKHLASALGGGAPETAGADVPGLSHTIVLIPKISETPIRFPRRASRLGRPVHASPA
jgi:16S rRNA (guanine527-N7)-methyltransferase